MSQHLIKILNEPESPPMLRRNAVTTLGRMSLSYPYEMCQYIPQCIQSWLVYIFFKLAHMYISAHALLNVSGAARSMMSVTLTRGKLLSKAYAKSRKLTTWVLLNT